MEAEIRSTLAEKGRSSAMYGRVPGGCTCCLLFLAPLWLFNSELLVPQLGVRLCASTLASISPRSPSCSRKTRMVFRGVTQCRSCQLFVMQSWQYWT